MHIGCLPRLVDWVTKTLNGFAGVGCIIELFQIALFFIALYILWINKDGYEEILRQDALAKELYAQNKKRQLFKQNDIKNMKAKKKQKESLKKKKKKKIVHRPKKKSQMIELGNIISSSFDPNDSQKNESELKFNPSTFT